MAGTVVVTGSGGRIGTILRQALSGSCRVRGIDRVDLATVPLVTAAMPSRPDGPYALLSKVFGESLGHGGGVRPGGLCGASDNTWKIYDTPRARTVLGYAPRDDAERFRGR